MKPTDEENLIEKLYTEYEKRKEMQRKRSIILLFIEIPFIRTWYKFWKL